MTSFVSVPSPVAPDDLSQLTVPSSVKVVLLSSPQKAQVPAFNQGQFANLLLPIPTRDGQPRPLKESGCGLMTWTSALAAAGCVAPQFDPVARKFSRPTSPTPIDPASFLQYLINWCRSKSPESSDGSPTLQKVFAPDGQGALHNEAKELTDALNDLLTLSRPDVTGATLTTTAEVPNAPYGQDLPGLTAHLDSGEMAILAVAFKSIDEVDENSKLNAAHQVLAVGYVRSGSRLFYLICDSGFDPQSPYPLQKRFGGPISVNDALAFAATPFHNHGDGKVRGLGIIWRIVRFRRLVGLKAWTGLSAVSG